MDQHPVVPGCAALTQDLQAGSHRLCAGGAAAARNPGVRTNKSRRMLLELLIVVRQHDQCRGQSRHGRQRRQRVGDHRATGQRRVLFGPPDSSARTDTGAGNEGKTTLGGRHGRRF